MLDMLQISSLPVVGTGGGYHSATPPRSVFSSTSYTHTYIHATYIHTYAGKLVSPPLTPLGRVDGPYSLGLVRSVRNASCPLVCVPDPSYPLFRFSSRGVWNPDRIASHRIAGQASV